MHSGSYTVQYLICMDITHKNLSFYTVSGLILSYVKHVLLILYCTQIFSNSLLMPQRLYVKVTSGLLREKNLL